MQFIDLAAQQDRIRDRLEPRIREVLSHGRYIMGPEVTELEERLADFVGVSHCISCGNGTDALQIAQMALGVEQEDEVITPAFSFIATAETIAVLGARPVFVDIDPATYNLDPARLEQALNPRTKAIIPVSLYGQCAAMDEINEIAGQHGVPVIEDAAQSFGATYKGRRSCALSEVSCTSFFPSKPLGAYGDGGALFTNDDGLAEELRLIARHGQERRYHHVRVGVNSRLDSIQAAVLLSKLEVFEEELSLRDRAARRYLDLLADIPGLTLPTIEPGNTSAWAQFTIRVPRRADIREALKGNGIPTAVHYPRPLHRQPALAGGSPPDIPETERAADEVMSLPMHPYLTSRDQQRVADALRKALA
jgi:UDP-2-acetamido-2-deoxy-ribo-hexuluronate aminotransferase